MKLIMVPFLLLFSLLLLLLSPSATEAADAVLDIDGNAVKRGAEYYVLPRPGIGGGLTLASRPNATCPLFVAADSSEVSTGLPVTFSPLDDRDGTLTLSTDTNVAFSASTICAQSTVWKLQSDESTGRIYVATGGVVGSPSRETTDNWPFKVEKDGEGGYKLAFCPKVCEFCNPLCGDLGFFIEGGTEWLGFRGSPFSVEFKKA